MHKKSNTELLDKIAILLTQSGRTVTVAESCTGGTLSGLLTSVSGSSVFFPGGIVVYSNEVKIREVGVERELIDESGAVCEEVAVQLAEGIREKLGSDFGIGITGIAGPGGGTEEKPVGLVYAAVAQADHTVCSELRLNGDREEIRKQTCLEALQMLRRLLES